MKARSSLLFLLLWIPFGGGAQADLCRGKTGMENNIVHDGRYGVQRDRYHEVLGRIEKPVTEDSAQNTAYRNHARQEAYADAFQKINALGLSYSHAAPRYIEGFLRLHSMGDKSIRDQEIRLFLEKETLDCSKKAYIFQVHLLVPRFPTLEAELAQQLRRLTERYLSSQDRTEGKIEIVLSEILHLAAEDEEFRGLLQGYLDDPEFLDRLEYRDDDTRRFFLGQGDDVQISGYDLGQYRVNSVIGSIIDQTVRAKVEETLRSFRQVRVVCTGFTDTTKVKGRISYFGRARVGSALHEPFVYDPSALSSEIRITTNHQLSYVRGHEGIAALVEALGPRSQNPRLKLLYSGGGPLTSKYPNDPQSRKIKFTIQFKGGRK